MNKIIFTISFVLAILISNCAFAEDSDTAEPAKPDSLAPFKAADTNGDGGLSKDELAKTSVFLFALIKRNFDEMDADKDGKVTIEERDAWVKAQREKASKPKKKPVS